MAFVLNHGLAEEVDSSLLARPLAVSVALAAGLSLICAAALRNRWRGAFVATIVMAVLFTTYPAYWLYSLFGPQVGLAIAGAALGLAMAIAEVAFLRSQKAGRTIGLPPAGTLNGFSVMLLVVVLATNASSWLPDASAADTDVFPASSGAQTPDIVVILLDGYPRTDVLQRRLDVDDSEFLEALRIRGFEVASASHSNYVFTELTLPSMFQMRYLQGIPAIGRLVGSRGAFHRTLRQEAVGGGAFSTLRQAGYEIDISPPGWEHVSLRAAGDRVLDDGEITDFERGLLERTWLMDLITIAKPDLIVGSVRNRVVHAFDHIDAFAHEPATRPRFLFVHVPAPHFPLVVDQRGEALPVSARFLNAQTPAEMHLSREEYSRRWADELNYLHRRVLGAVEELQTARRPPVVIVMSDHGYTQEVQPDDPQARFGNLFAAYTPGASHVFHDTQTPVNIFPFLMNHYLGTRIPFSPDRFFLSPSPRDPLLLTEVSDPDARPGK